MVPPDLQKDDMTSTATPPAPDSPSSLPARPGGDR